MWACLIYGRTITSTFSVEHFHHTSFLSLVLSLLFLLHSQVSNAQKLGPKLPHFNKIYQLGASKADTGNLIRESQSSSTICARLPYGENFFAGPTGRCSDGLLIIDYTAISAGLQFLRPYKQNGADFSNGVNFAVMGATALPVETLAAMNIISPYTRSSLNVQLDWMASFFNSTCHNSTNCAGKNANALFMVGEIGSNDFNYALFQGKSIQQAKEMVPQIVGVIANGVKRVIQFGATQIVVPGNYPVGCFPLYLTGFQTNDSTAYDEFHCIKAINDLSTYYNKQLQLALTELRAQNPRITIMYADYYNAYLRILSKAPLLGFDINSVQKACCGIGGAYNFNRSGLCSTAGVPVCPDPYRYISWDGIHLTQHANKLVFGWLMHNTFAKLLPHV